MSRPEISILVPVYNVDRYLEACLQSLLVQDHPRYEVVCVDDGSTDGSAGILKDYAAAHPALRVVSHGSNLGVPSARNTCIRNCIGDYFLFVDPDDFIAPFTLSAMYEVARDDDADMVIAGMVKCDEADGSIRTGFQTGYLSTVFRRVTVFEEPRLLASVESVNRLIRRDFIDASGLYFTTDPRRYEDMVTFKWLLHGATVSSVPELTYFYRSRSDGNGDPSITQQRDLPALTDRIRAYADLADHVIANGYFRSAADPLTSDFSNTKLGAGLRWIVPMAMERLGESFDDVQAKRFFGEMRDLLRMVPADFVEGLGEPYASMGKVLVALALPEAVERVMEEFSDLITE